MLMFLVEQFTYFNSQKTFFFFLIRCIAAASVSTLCLELFYLQSETSCLCSNFDGVARGQSQTNSDGCKETLNRL